MKQGKDTGQLVELVELVELAELVELIELIELIELTELVELVGLGGIVEIIEFERRSQRLSLLSFDLGTWRTSRKKNCPSVDHNIPSGLQSIGHGKNSGANLNLWFSCWTRNYKLWYSLTFVFSFKVSNSNIYFNH